MSLLEALLELFWKPILALAPVDILMVLMIGLTVDLGWSSIARLAGALKERSHVRRDLKQRADLEVHREFLTSQVDVLRDEIRRVADEYDRVRGQADEIGQMLERLGVAEGELARLRLKLESTRMELHDLVARLQKWDHEAMPYVSLIVPCHNSESVIEETLRSLTGLDYAQKEIIVVDDASTDRTYERASRYSDSVTLVRRASSSGRKTGAINFGLNFAKGDIVVVVDDDTILRRDALSHLVVALPDKNVGAVAGNVKVKTKPHNILVGLQSAEYLVSMELGRSFQNESYKAQFVISGCFGAFRRDLLKRIGEYDIDNVTEDLDVTWKVYKLRKRVAYRRDAICYTEAPTSLKGLVRQRLRWDRGLFEVLSKHRNMLLNPRFGYVGLLLLPDTLFTEIVLLLIRPVWFATLILLQYPVLPALLLTVYFYILLEFFNTFAAGMLSEDKRNVLIAFYAPLMFIYKQFLGLVRIAALVSYISGRKMRW